MDILISRKIKEKLRQDFPNEWIHNSEIKYSEYRNGQYIMVSENIFRVFKDSCPSGDVSLIKETEIPEELKELFLKINCVYQEEEYDPLNVPCRGSFLYEKLMKSEELFNKIDTEVHDTSK